MPNCKITLSLDNNVLHCERLPNGIPFHTSIEVPTWYSKYDDICPTEDVLFYFIYATLTPVFREMPIDVEIKCLPSSPMLSRLVDDLKFHTDKNNRYIRMLPKYSLGKNVFVFNGHEPHRYMTFANRLAAISEGRVFYFDRRNDEQIGGPQFTVENFIAFLQKHDVGTIVTSNHLQRFFFNFDNIDIVTGLRKLGIKVFVIDNDPFENRPQFYSFRACNPPDWRFTVWPLLVREWDGFLGIDNVTYTPVLQDYSEEYRPRLRRDFKIIVASNLRFQIAQRVLPAIVVLSKAFHKDEVITKFPLWYLSMRYLVNNARIGLIEKYYHLTVLWSIFSGFTDVLKAKIIHWIDDKWSNRLEVYGDDLWQGLTNNYRGLLGSDDFDNLMQTNNLFLIPNLSPNYGSAFGPTFDMASGSRAWLCPKPASNVSLGIEFHDATSLNELIDNAFDIDGSKVEMYRQSLEHATVDALQKITGKLEMSRKSYFEICSEREEAQTQASIVDALSSPQMETFIGIYKQCLYALKYGDMFERFNDALPNKINQYNRIYS